MTPTLVRPKAESGSAATRIATKVRDYSKRVPRKGRPPKNGNEPVSPDFVSAYEKSRVEELTARSAIYRLKLRRMQGELLDRKLLVAELTAAFTSIKEIILGSKLSHHEKTDLLRNLSEIPVILESLPACTMFQNLS